MAIYIYIVITMFTVGLFALYLKSEKTFPLAAWMLFIGLVHGLIFKPLLLLVFGSNSILGRYILDSLTMDEFWLGGAWISLSCFILVSLIIFGNMVLNNVSRQEQFYYYRRSPKAYFDTNISCVMAVGSFIAVCYFLWLNPSLTSLEGKNSLATDSVSTYSGDGILRILINATFVIVFFMLHNMVVRHRYKRSKKIAVFCILVYLFFCFVSDQRGSILFGILSWTVFMRFAGIDFPKKNIFLTIGSAFTMVIYTTYIRFASGGGSALDIASATFANFAGKNFIDITKTIQIYKADFTYQLGSTFVDTIILFIPRQLYPEKSVVNIDTLIAKDIFGAEAIGAGAVPPGMLGEMIYNFGLLGVPVGLLLTGLLVVVTDNIRFGGNSFMLIFYTISLYAVGLGVMGSSFQSVFMSMVIVGIPLLIVYLITLRRL